MNCSELTTFPLVKIVFGLRDARIFAMALEQSRIASFSMDTNQFNLSNNDVTDVYICCRTPHAVGTIPTLHLQLMYRGHKC